MTKSAIQPVPHAHTPRNVNAQHKAEQAEASFNQRVALGMTHLFSAMSTFWMILTWIVAWIVLNATIVHFDPLPWPLLLCLASVPQLPLMIVIMVGQGLLGRHQELQAEETYQLAVKICKDNETIILHLGDLGARLAVLEAWQTDVPTRQVAPKDMRQFRTLTPGKEDQS